MITADLPEWTGYKDFHGNKIRVGNIVIVNYPYKGDDIVSLIGGLGNVNIGIAQPYKDGYAIVSSSCFFDLSNYDDSFDLEVAGWIEPGGYWAERKSLV